MNRLLLFVLLSLITASCARFSIKGEERVLARVYDEYLYESDLKKVIPAGTSGKDSLNLARSYIDNWIRQRLIVRQARNNLTSEQMNFSRQLEDYTNSLIIYTYENELVKQKLDTIVTDEEIQSYYESNQINFLLKENIIRLRYVKLSARAKEKQRMYQLLRSSDPEDYDRLNAFCNETGAACFLDGNKWIFFNDVLKEIPIRTDDQAAFLQKNRDIEITDSVSTFLVQFVEYRLKESTSPLELETQRIRNILLNKRKINLLQKMQEDVYQSALKNNNFEVY